MIILGCLWQCMGASLLHPWGHCGQRGACGLGMHTVGKVWWRLLRHTPRKVLYSVGWDRCIHHCGIWKVSKGRLGCVWRRMC